MISYADFEMLLSSAGPQGFTLLTRFTPPQRIGYDQPVQPFSFRPVVLDEALFEQLRTLALDSDEAGQVLHEHVFHKTGLEAEFRQAFHEAALFDVPLRLRLAMPASAPELHRIRWETLSLPLFADQQQPLTTERVLFSRLLYGDSQRPSRLRPKHDLRTVCLISNPSDLQSAYDNLAALDVVSELQRLRSGLAAFPRTELASQGRATLDELVAALRPNAAHGPADLLVIVAHGAVARDSEPYLLLEHPDGTAAAVTASQLCTALAELAELPRLIVLIACQSAGGPQMLQALGPRLAALGVPAVVAMQDSIAFASAARFQETFYRELLVDGQIDRAVAVARAALRRNQHGDWWVPLLFLGSRSSQLWANEAADQHWHLKRWLHARTTGLQSAGLDALAHALVACPACPQSAELAQFADLDSLVAQIGYFDAAAPAFATLLALLDRELPLAVAWQQVLALRGLLRDTALTIDELRTLYVLSAPPGPDCRMPPEAPTRPELLAAVLARLARGRASEGGGLPPLLAFVNHLCSDFAHRLTAQQRSALAAWLAHNCQYLGLRLVAAQPTTPTIGAAYLLLVINPLRQLDLARLAATPVTVEAWLLLADGAGQYFAPERTAPLRETRFADLQEVMLDLLSRVNRRLSGQSVALDIEVFLPFELLLFVGVEHWHKKGLGKIPLGREHRVVVRVLERIDPQTSYDLEQSWRAMWALAEQRRTASAAASLAWIDSDQYCRAGQLAAYVKSQQMIGLAQTYLPLNSAGEVDAQVFDLLADVLGAGVSVALFVRPARHDPASARQELAGRMGGLSVADIRDFVRDQRISALASGELNHLGHHLVLLWDDPQRQPPQIAYAEPEES
jgi:hypothetical protein